MRIIIEPRKTEEDEDAIKNLIFVVSALKKEDRKIILSKANTLRANDILDNLESRRKIWQDWC